MGLPSLPGHEVEVVDEAPQPQGERGFIYVRRMNLAIRYADGTRSAPFPYFCAERTRMDAVVVVPHYTEGGERHVVLRSSVRPPLVVRAVESWPIPTGPSLGELWELPAGLIEPDEQSPAGLVRCARRELHEETGIDAEEEAIQPLGPPAFPSPGMMGECHYYFHVAIDPAARVAPPEDGSALERAAVLLDVPLRLALEGVRAGQVADAKTEIALRRLAELVGT
jgi:ADP-ribose pyrophosphatase